MIDVKVSNNKKICDYVRQGMTPEAVKGVSLLIFPTDNRDE